MKICFKFLFLLLVYILNILPSNSMVSSIKWSKWDTKAFQKSQAEQKPILLYIEALNHNSHLMEEKTFSDKEIQRLINSHFISVKVDSNARPDLRNRFKRYELPVIAVLTANGVILAKRGGFVSKEEFFADLSSLSHTKEPEVNRDFEESEAIPSEDSLLSTELRDQLFYNHYDVFDPEVGGLNRYYMSLDFNFIQFAILRAQKGFKEDRRIANKTIKNAQELIDPVWGGIYSYSTHGGWNFPSYDKSSDKQAEAIKSFSLAYKHFGEVDYIDSALKVHKYLSRFLKSPRGGFYTSQDSDIVKGEDGANYFMLNGYERRLLGVPEIDKNVYSNHNGLVIDSLVDLYRATDRKKYLHQAVIAANWIIDNRAQKNSIFDFALWVLSNPKRMVERIKHLIYFKGLPEISFRHGEQKSDISFLSDTLNMGLGFIALYKETHDKKWLIKAEQSLLFIIKTFQHPSGGYMTAQYKPQNIYPNLIVRDVNENVNLVRLSCKLYSETKKTIYKNAASHAMKYLSSPDIATNEIDPSGILLAELKYIKALNE